MVNTSGLDSSTVPEPSRTILRVCKWLLVTFLIYLAYLVLLGPFHALNGRGVFDFAPRPIRDVFYAPAVPLVSLLGPFDLYDSYLNLWYDDPHEAVTTPM